MSATSTTLRATTPVTPRSTQCSLINNALDFHMGVLQEHDLLSPVPSLQLRPGSLGAGGEGLGELEGCTPPSAFVSDSQAFNNDYWPTIQKFIKEGDEVCCQPIPDAVGGVGNGDVVVEVLLAGVESHCQHPHYHFTLCLLLNLPPLSSPLGHLGSGTPSLLQVKTCQQKGACAACWC
eukprot:2420806-Rhodomonas_salina.1